MSADTEAWRLQAACRGRSTSTFYPAPYDRRALPVLRRFCAGCAVNVQCLAYALEHHERGVWAGTDEEERAQLRALARLSVTPSP